MDANFSSSLIRLPSLCTASSTTSNVFEFELNPFTTPLHPIRKGVASVSSAASSAHPPGRLVIGKSMQEPGSGTVFEGQLCAAKGPSDCRDLVAVGLRSKRLLGLKNIDVYSIALFVDPTSLQKELAGKIKGHSAESLAKDQMFLDAVAASPGVQKSIQIVVTSGLVNKKKLVDALRERIEPPLVKMGKRALVSDFNRLFDGVDVRKGTTITFNSLRGGALACAIDGRDAGTIRAPEVAAVLVGVYTGADAVQPNIKANFAQGLAAAALS